MKSAAEKREEGDGKRRSNTILAYTNTKRVVLPIARLRLLASVGCVSVCLSFSTGGFIRDKLSKYV